MTCATCRFRDAESKQCRESPPIPFVSVRPNRIGGVTTVANAAWPPVPDDGWCGKHAPRLEVAP